MKVGTNNSGWPRIPKRLPRSAFGGPTARLELLGFQTPEMVITLGANAVAELHVGMTADVVLDLLPVVLIVADFLTVRADGQ